jgi:hypothetical protein
LGVADFLNVDIGKMEDDLQIYLGGGRAWGRFRKSFCHLEDFDSFTNNFLGHGRFYFLMCLGGGGVAEIILHFLGKTI